MRARTLRPEDTRQFMALLGAGAGATQLQRAHAIQRAMRKQGLELHSCSAPLRARQGFKIANAVRMAGGGLINSAPWARLLFCLSALEALVVLGVVQSASRRYARGLAEPCTARRPARDARLYGA